MKISKSFTVRISGNYQTYEFQTGLEVEGLFNTEEEERKNLEDDLFNTCKNAVNRNIAAFAAEDQNFRVVLLSRDKELEKVMKVHNAGMPERKSILH